MYGAGRASDVYLYIVQRTQIYLDEQQTTRLDERAASEGVSRSTVIRRAVDEYFAHDHSDAAEWRRRWRKAVSRTAGIAPHLPDGASYVEELRAADVERLRGLDL